MFQKGTGERFKYKDAVLKLYPKAVCVKMTYKYATLFHVKNEHGGISISKEFRSAENAWADVWAKNQKVK